MNFTELLATTVKSKIEDICVNISTITDDYYFTYIEYEDSEKLGVWIVGADMHERFLIINKEHIVTVQVVYQEDLKFDGKKPDKMFI